MTDTGSTDAEFAAIVKAMAAAGERQDVELKAELPVQVRDLGKEIAAFATSNDGTILIGVSDAGEIIGIADGDKQGVRAQLLARIEGICANVVRPMVMPKLRFAVIDGAVVLAITVPKGEAPVYYSNNVPYVRQLTSSRPAEPQDVIDLILEWDRARRGEPVEPTPEESFLSEVASLVNNVLVHGSELSTRPIKPWLTDVLSRLEGLAANARDLALRTPTSLDGIAAPLSEVAQQLEAGVHERVGINFGANARRGAIECAMVTARRIREDWTPPHKIGAESVAGVTAAVEAAARRVADLARRSDAMLRQHRLDELRGDIAEQGLIFLKAASFGIGVGDEASRAALEEIARSLRELETRTIYHDGGVSLQKMVDDLHVANERLQALVARLGANDGKA